MRKFDCLIIGLFLFVSLSCATSQITDDRIHVIFNGDHADPSIVRDGDDFYLTYTSHNKQPGLKIWHSKNLVDWTPIGYALTENLGSVWAPDIIKHDDLFYIYFPVEGKCYVTTSKTPAGPWSKPVLLDIKGSWIDPGHIADDKGNRYLHLNGGGMVPLSKDGLKVTGNPISVYNGWKYPADWNVECFCLESPKLIRLGDYYYLTSAQGGTAGPATSHMIVTARAKSPEGPWENSPYNPVVHTYSADEKWWSKGHGTIFDDADGNWYVIYHAYRKGKTAYGRHILIERVRLTDDGWVVTERDREKEGSFEVHFNEKVTDDNFDKAELNLQWQMTTEEEWGETNYELGSGEFTFINKNEYMQTLQVSPSDKNYEVQIELGSRSRQTEVGIAIWYSETHMAGIGVQGDEVILRSHHGGKRPIKGVEGEKVRFLKIHLEDQCASFFYSTDGIKWTMHDRSLEVSAYTHNALGGFSYLRPAIYASGKGKASINFFKFKPVK
ncbi:MAG: family 43 glycosylhydrolase [Planctomycetes bacterium]|nr:family 43 glycosylhydrolase [Planctomycetota bacterium]